MNSTEYIFPENIRFDQNINPFENNDTNEKKETNDQLCDRIYSFIWFMKNYMEGKNIDETFIDQSNNKIKPIDDFKNMISKDGKSTIPANFGETFFYKNFYKDSYGENKMKIPTDEQKKIINNLIHDSIEGDSVNEKVFYEKIHIDNTYEKNFITYGDFVMNDNKNTNKRIYADGRNLYNTGLIGRLLADIISYKKSYGDDQSKYAIMDYDRIDNGTIICESSIYSLNDNAFKVTGMKVAKKDIIIYSCILHPIYFPKDTSELDITILKKYFNPYVKKNFGLTMCYINDLNKVSFCKDAFKNGGIYIFDPKLAFLIQHFELKFDDKNSNMWNTPYYTTINEKNLNEVDKGIRITILTLQKYAAIRRYMWSKDPDYASEVYKTDPKDIINELRDPYSLLPYTDEHISEFTKYETDQKDPRYVPENINLTLIPYSIFVDYPSLYLPNFKNETRDNLLIKLKYNINTIQNEKRTLEGDTKSLQRLTQTILESKKRQIILENEKTQLENKKKQLDKQILDEKLDEQLYKQILETINTLSGEIGGASNYNIIKKKLNQMLTIKIPTIITKLITNIDDLHNTITEIRNTKVLIESTEDTIKSIRTKLAGILQKDEQLKNNNKLKEMLSKKSAKKSINKLKDEIKDEMLKQLKARLKKQIDEEIVSNWKWATDESKSIEQIYNELDALIPHKPDWTLNRPYQDIEKIEIKRIPEVEAIFAPLLAKNEIEYEIKHPDEVEKQVKEQELIIAPTIEDLPSTKIARLKGFLGTIKNPFARTKGGSRNKTVKKKNLKKL